MRDAGVYASLVIDTPPGGGGGGGGGGLTESDPPPPQAIRLATATALQTSFNILSSVLWSTHGRYCDARERSSTFRVTRGGLLQRRGESMLGHCEFFVWLLPASAYAASCIVFNSMIFSRRVVAGSLSTTVSPTLLPTRVLPMGDDMLTCPSSNSTESPNTRL